MMVRRNAVLALLCCSALVVPAVLADPASDAMKAGRDAAQKARDAADKAMKDAKDAAKPKDASMDEAAMMAMYMEMAQPGEDHKIIQQFAGQWQAEMQMWMDPAQKEPRVSKGTLEVTPLHGGRYVRGEFKGTFDMPGPDGKMQSMPFTGTMLWGYNNVEKRYESTWMDSMSTGIMMSTGQASADGKSVESRAEFRMPGPDGKMATYKQRELVTMHSPDRYTMQMWHSGPMHEGEMKVMEITYTRAAASGPAEKK
jgi:hypothetical protein